MKQIGINVLLPLSVVGLLGTGCAQWQQSWKQSNQYTQQFEHMFLAAERTRYPALGPAAPAREMAPMTAPTAVPDRPMAPKAVAAAPMGFQHVPKPEVSAKHVVSGRVLVPVAPLIEVGDRSAVAGRLDIEEVPNSMIASATTTQPVAENNAVKEAESRTTPPTVVATESTKEPKTVTLKDSNKGHLAGLGDGSVAGELLAAAQRTVGIESDLDPEGFAKHLLQVNDLDIAIKGRQSVVKAIYEHLNQTDQLLEGSVEPIPGDLVFFHNTYDRDEDQRADDWFTLVGVVERMDGDGTVQFIAFYENQVRRLQLNLDRPSTAQVELADKVLNSALRTRKLSDRPYTSYLAGELFASYGRLR